MSDFDEASIRALREQGGLRAFLREQQAEGRARRGQEPAVSGSQPGVWPTGASPPGHLLHPEWAVLCPHCGASPGTRCTSRARGRPLAIPSHDARITTWTNRPQEEPP